MDMMQTNAINLNILIVDSINKIQYNMFIIQTNMKRGLYAGTCWIIRNS